MSRAVRLALLLVLLAVIVPATAQDRDAGGPGPDDEFLAGYIEAILVRELGWSRDSFFLAVDRGVATLTLFGDDPLRKGRAQEELGDIEGLQGLEIAVVEREEWAPPREDPSGWRWDEWLGLTDTGVPFAVGELFDPLIADPKQPRFFASTRYYDTSLDATTLAAVGFGETFGLYRRQGQRPGDGVQISISGGIFSQFNLESPSFDLINTDFIVGVPVTWREAPWSARLRLYHQSSHLGDEFLLNTRSDRVNLSYESLELLGSYAHERWRVYGGGEVLVHREPKDLDRFLAHGGLEYRGRSTRLGAGRVVGGLDVKAFQEHDWEPDVSLKVGLEFGQAEPGRRRLRIMLEGFRGFSPHGQFYTDRISYYGLGAAVGF